MRLFQRSVAALVLTLPLEAFAQTNHRWITTEPAQIVFGEMVTLTVSGIWRDSCVPQRVSMSGRFHRRLLTLDTGNPGACFFVLTPYRVETSVRFEDLGGVDFGTVRVTLATSRGEVLGEQDLAVQSRSSSAPRISEYRVDGAWYFPQASGSGLVLEHNKDRNVDRVWGMWTNYASDGSPRWHLFQDASWQTPTRLIGKIHRLTSVPFACSGQFPNSDCNFAPQSAAASINVGEFAIDFASDKSAVLVMSQRDGAQLLPGTPVPLSKLE